MTRTNPILSQNQSKMRLRAWLKILKTSDLIEKQLREKLRAEFDTTLPRFDVMSALSRCEKGMKMSQLSGALKVSNGNVTGIVDRLVNDSHVVRVAVEGDRRANLVRLTKGGRERFDEYAAAHEKWLNNLLSDLSSGDAEILISLLGSITDQEETG